jgi:hypothetical protein
MSLPSKGTAAFLQWFINYEAKRASEPLFLIATSEGSKHLNGSKGAVVAQFESVTQISNGTDRVYSFVPLSEMIDKGFCDNSELSYFQDYDPHVEFIILVVIINKKTTLMERASGKIKKDAYLEFDPSGNAGLRGCIVKDPETKHEKVKVSDTVVTGSTFVCSCCEKRILRLLKCSRCRVAAYCNSECQLQDWKAHKVYCNIYAQK